MERVQIYLELADRQTLEQWAREAQKSRSAIVRELIRERARQERRAALRKAAGMMANAYHQDSALTDTRTLDGDDFLAEPGAFVE